jgi:pilus assembly protein Flp/PilA
MSKVFAFLNDESGNTAIEYGLVAAGMSVAIITAVNTAGSTLSARLLYLVDSLSAH